LLNAPDRVMDFFTAAFDILACFRHRIAPVDTQKAGDIDKMKSVFTMRSRDQELGIARPAGVGATTG